MLGPKRKPKVWFMYPEILKTMILQHTLLCPKVLQKSHFLPFPYGYFFQFCSVERQHGNFIFAFCFHGGVLGLEKHIQTRNMKKKICAQKKWWKQVRLLWATENGVAQCRRSFSKSR